MIAHKEELMASPEIQGSLVLLWAGEDPALHSSLLEQLETAGVPFVDKPASGAPKGDVFNFEQRASFGFEVSVLSSNLATAEGILEGLLDEEPLDLELPGEDDAAPAAETPAHLSQATSAVWSGNDPERLEFLSQALKENEIPVRVETRGQEATIYVPPEEETLAGEIIREIVEGAPPQ
jgi:hypothetical protein